MDFGIVMGVNPPDPSAGSPGVPPYDFFEAARYAMGDTLRYAEKMDLLQMEPHDDLTSTGFALANPGQEYLVLQVKNEADPFTVKLNAGTYAAEWFSLNLRETTNAEEVTVQNDGEVRFMAPFSEAGPAVLYLKRLEH
jgi:hypothetical protein